MNVKFKNNLLSRIIFIFLICVTSFQSAYAGDPKVRCDLADAMHPKAHLQAEFDGYIKKVDMATGDPYCKVGKCSKSGKNFIKAPLTEAEWAKILESPANRIEIYNKYNTLKKNGLQGPLGDAILAFAKKEFINQGSKGKALRASVAAAASRYGKVSLKALGVGVGIGMTIMCAPVDAIADNLINPTELGDSDIHFNPGPKWYCESIFGDEEARKQLTCLERALDVIHYRWKVADLVCQDRLLFDRCFHKVFTPETCVSIHDSIMKRLERAQSIVDSYEAGLDFCINDCMVEPDKCDNVDPNVAAMRQLAKNIRDSGVFEADDVCSDTGKRGQSMEEFSLEAGISMSNVKEDETCCKEGPRLCENLD